MDQSESARRHTRRKQFWGFLALFLAGTLGASTLLQRLVSPVGDAVVAAAREHDRHLTGLLLADAPDRYTVFDGVSYHPVKRSGQDLQSFIGRKVALAGILDPKTGSFEVSKIRVAD